MGAVPIAPEDITSESTSATPPWWANTSEEPISKTRASAALGFMVTTQITVTRKNTIKTTIFSNWPICKAKEVRRKRSSEGCKALWMQNLRRTLGLAPVPAATRRLSQANRAESKGKREESY